MISGDELKELRSLIHKFTRNFLDRRLASLPSFEIVQAPISRGDILRLKELSRKLDYEQALAEEAISKASGCKHCHKPPKVVYEIYCTEHEWRLPEPATDIDTALKRWEESNK